MNANRLLPVSDNNDIKQSADPKTGIPLHIHPQHYDTHQNHPSIFHYGNRTHG